MTIFIVQLEAIYSRLAVVCSSDCIGSFEVRIDVINESRENSSKLSRLIIRSTRVCLGVGVYASFPFTLTPTSSPKPTTHTLLNDTNNSWIRFKVREAMSFFSRIRIKSAKIFIYAIFMNDPIKYYDSIPPYMVTLKNVFLLVPVNNDNIKNGDESDVDCGGSSGKKCAVGKTCKVTGDCNNVLCTRGVCQNPSCSDGLKNGGETDVDCGGSGSCPRCDNWKRCSSPTDCVSKVCSGNQCQAPMNHDNVMNGDESDVDCGGSSGKKCAVGKTCKVTGDCDNVLCTGGVCQNPSCSDGLKNGGETDVDCGGSGSCPRCDNWKRCSSPTDCVSKVCSAPMDHDNVMNGDESDVDCGGSSGKKCAVGKTCKVTGDCDNVFVCFSLSLNLFNALLKIETFRVKCSNFVAKNILCISFRTRAIYIIEEKLLVYITK
uniref:Putative lipoprotein-like protein n=1 Tax=Adineta vaga TaxID=104782 RepID=B3G4R1_ADIVA|nr:putative lipoprotein-like protein [Adineta vaga]